MEYTDALLDTLRWEGDPLADAVIAAVEASGEAGAVNAVLRHLLTNNQPVPAELPAPVQAFLEQTRTPPSWTDHDRIRRAGTFFTTHGMSIGTVLSTAALVECYAAQRAVKVLAFTHQLDHPQRRVAETAQFCFYMMGAHGFDAEGQFIPAVQKVRLMHAAIRYFITRSGRWPHAELGEPICQEDLLGALMLFTTDVLQGLDRLGIPVAHQDAEDYYYVWTIAGTMLGIRPDIIPETLTEAEALNAMLRHRHMGPSPEGVHLTGCLLDMCNDLIPGRWFDGITPALIRLMVGDEIADWMEVPHTSWDHIVAHLPWMERLEDGAGLDAPALARHLLGKVNWALVQGEFLVVKGLRPVTYDIPADLRAAWGLDKEENQ